MLKIIPQGFLDGACLLYAVQNAFKALINPELRLTAYYVKYRMESKWQQFVGLVPSPHNFLDGSGSGVGLKTNRQESEVILSMLRNSCPIFSSKAHEFQVRRISIQEFREKKDYRSSVVIFPTTGRASTDCHEYLVHWFVAVGRDSGHLLLACSSAVYAGREYDERMDPLTGHVFNDRIKTGRINKTCMGAEYIYQVEVAPKP